MEKYIFLDFDGVLNTEQYQAELAIEGKPCKDIYGPIFDPRTIKQLDEIIKMTGAKIVITSSWRFIHSLNILHQMWEDRGLPGDVYSILTTESSSKSRGEEIIDWLQKNDNRFVIIDDENDFNLIQQESLIITNNVRGLTRKDAQKAIEILNKE